MLHFIKHNATDNRDFPYLNRQQSGTSLTHSLARVWNTARASIPRNTTCI